MPLLFPLPRLLQFNYESSVTYNEDGYSILSVKGTLEIPLTRNPDQKTRTYQSTADDLRGEIERRVMSGIDLTRFHMVRRNFSLSRDKRTLTWEFQAEEKPYMDLPLACSIARGSFNVRPAKAGMGLCSWLCTLRATYTVRGDAPRRTAWINFLGLLRVRMSQSQKGLIPQAPRVNQNPPSRTQVALQNVASFLPGGKTVLDQFRLLSNAANKPVELTTKALLMDFTVDEGLYLDSKTTTFSASWKITTVLSNILLASGLWKKAPEAVAGPGAETRGLWALSMADVSGAQSWLPNKMVAKGDVIVDFGGGQ